MAMRRAENAKDDYSKTQAGEYIKHRKEKYQHDAFYALQKEGKDTSDKSIERYLKNNAVYQSLSEDEEKIQKGTLDDTLLLRYANNEINQRNAEQAVTDKRDKDLNDSYKEAREAQARGEYVDHLTIAQKMVDKGHSYTQMGPNGIITSDKKLYDAWKQLIANNGLLDGKDFNGDNATTMTKFAEYGNNYFYLYTFYPGIDEALVADGVMTELPPVQMSTEWDNSPAASVGEELDKALNNEFFEFLQMKCATAQTTVMRRKDQLTARSYKDTGDVGFSIKFRCYPGQQVGSKAMTNAKEWLLILSMTTPINSACTFSMTNAMGQLVQAADGAANAFKEMKEAMRGDQAAGKEKADDPEQTEAYANVEGFNKYITGAGAVTLDKFDKTNARISNPKVFGANIFGLRIYPFIYNKIIPVYISSWNVTPSKEWNEKANDHFYYDFTLNCSMDQKPSAQVWDTMIKS